MPITNFKNLQLRNILCCFVASGFGATSATAQWGSYSGTSTAMTGTFVGAGGAYSGSYKCSLSNIVDGGNNGVPGMVGYQDTDLTNSFRNNWPTNSPNSSFDFVGFTYNHTRDSYLVTVDFSNLSSGYLPTGTVFATLDLDIEEQFQEMEAQDSDGNWITGNWLNRISGVKGLLDYSDYEGDITGFISPPTWTQSNGVNDVVGIEDNENACFYGFTTALDIRKITFTVNKYSLTNYDHNGGSGLALMAVPEPTTMIILGAGVFAMGRRRASAKRKSGMKS
ncbi:MAG: PEP-CTERM sorting domain-containing protein [Chthonomonadaceae bacterium]|nr:PEP-CTERM sorting domain-containing protein [Chthonomonadaceae bacterium]